MSLAQKVVKTEEQLQVEKSLLEGVVSRAGTLFFTWSFISTLYGFLSIDLFRHKMPELSLWDNVWPRIVFSSIPLYLTAILYKRHQSKTKIKAFLTIFLLPVFLVGASMIKAWPLIWGGDYNFYLQFHATNIIAMASGIFVISASPRLVLSQAIGFIIIYFGPLFYLFSNSDYNTQLAQIIFSDSLMVAIILVVTLKSIYQLRLDLAYDENKRRHKASLFLGKKLADAIYESRTMVLEDFTREGLIMSVDLRGYTKFVQSTDQSIVRLFMSDYYSLVTKVLSTKKSFLHKTSGDGLLISFGIMENDVDLSDLPEARQTDELIHARKKVECLRQANLVFLELADGLEILAKKHQISQAIVLGSGCAFGSIEVIVRGDENYRQELDIQGATIIRAVRLESYSKLLNFQIDAESSFMLLSTELMTSAGLEQGFKTWMVTSEKDQVRDFPEIKMMLYRQWKHQRSRSATRVA